MFFSECVPFEWASWRGGVPSTGGRQWRRHPVGSNSTLTDPCSGWTGSSRKWVRRPCAALLWRSYNDDDESKKKYFRVFKNVIRKKVSKYYFSNFVFCCAFLSDIFRTKFRTFFRKMNEINDFIVFPDFEWKWSLFEVKKKNVFVAKTNVF